MRPALAAASDAMVILAFAAVGRASHQEANPVVGVFVTAWPFLVGAALGWLVVWARSRRWPLTVGPGIPVLVCAVVGGMLLRAATGQGTALAFVVVATVVLAVLLLGWRAVLGRRTSR